MKKAGISFILCFLILILNQILVVNWKSSDLADKMDLISTLNYFAYFFGFLGGVFLLINQNKD